MCQRIGSGLCRISRIAVTFFSSCIIEGISATCETIVFVCFIEQIIYRATHCDRLHTRQFEGICQVQIANEVSIQYLIVTFSIGHILLADVLGLQGCFKSSIRITETIVQNKVR